jgi:hypothetical protein
MVTEPDLRSWLASFDLDEPLAADADSFGQVPLAGLQVGAAVFDGCAQFCGGTDDHSGYNVRVRLHGGM